MPFGKSLTAARKARIEVDDIIGGADGQAAWWATSDDERSTRAAAAGAAAEPPPVEQRAPRIQAPARPPLAHTLEQNINILQEMGLANRTRALQVCVWVCVCVCLFTRAMQVLEGCNNDLEVAVALLIAALE